MVFSSYLFLFYFLPTTLLLYYAVPRRIKHLLLTIVSYFFYGWANPLFVLILLGSTTVDYLCGLAIARHEPGTSAQQAKLTEFPQSRTRTQRLALITSIVSNLLLLSFFKYFNFASDNFDIFVTWLGMPELRLERTITVILPLGISFYTFQSMSYTIDVYRSKARPLRNFIDFACYVSMFPQLVAGPIIRFSEVADQLTQRTHSLKKFSRGIAFISVGLAKKILIANPCGKVADIAFGAISLGMIDAWYGVTAYAFQIYFDFSAYSDIAIGLGLMLGFVFSKNFDSPYLAESITEFWKRWHISLSTWLRDYLYIPLGGNRTGSLRTYVNLTLVMLLGGLWHGASWNFIVWGGLHSILLIIERLRSKVSLYHILPKQIRTSLTFVLVLFTWVFFRAEDLPSALQYVSSMLGFQVIHEPANLLSGVLYKPYYLGSFFIAAIITWVCPQTWNWTQTITTGKTALIIMLWLSALAILCTQEYNPFIYFIF